MNDKLIDCPHCKSHETCYEIDNNLEIKTKSCFSCGFTTNSLMKIGETFYEEQMSILPELYKDVATIGSDNLIWIPTVINIADKGMVFYNGTNKENAKWSSVRAVKVTEEEKAKYPIKGKPGQFYEWRMAMDTLQTFEMQEFASALDYIGALA